MVLSPDNSDCLESSVSRAIWNSLPKHSNTHPLTGSPARYCALKPSFKMATTVMTMDA
jgi:hypothetical protein